MAQAKREELMIDKPLMTLSLNFGAMYLIKILLLAFLIDLLLYPCNDNLFNISGKFFIK